MKCICFVRPTSESIQALVEELRDPKYGDYYLYSSNTIKKSTLERIAESDDHEVIQSVMVGVFLFFYLFFFWGADRR